MKYKIALFSVIVLAGLTLAYTQLDSNQPITSSETECSVNEDCVPASPCHADSCITREAYDEYYGDAAMMYCTTECAPGTMDCGQGSCACIDNKCEVNWV